MHNNEWQIFNSDFLKKQKKPEKVCVVEVSHERTRLQLPKKHAHCLSRKPGKREMHTIIVLISGSCSNIDFLLTETSTCTLQF